MCTIVNAILQMRKLSHNAVKSFSPSSTAIQHYIESTPYSNPPCIMWNPSEMT